MAAGTQAIWNPSSSDLSKPNPAAPKTNAAGQTGSASTGSTSIAANDFLTLLVTEMKNQDPTATTDPNEYVNQLVQVNSLQQLISINETLQNAAALKSNSHFAPASAPEGLSAVQSATAQASDSPAAPPATGEQGSSSTLKSAAARIATALTSKQ